MYVNERTLDYGSDGREAVGRLLEMGYNSGVITEKPKIDWVEVPEEVAKKA
jgi:1,4-dihydroxy-6-naphthoate synthase